ncbi:hypothetical protein LJR225_000594 [Phenylobacterium sp. LjRoot225]|uniref:hypothetical protein n=1 Tax=Phenylobacterium sp. LjRoot225 TaxID=3342285 RepID=UPI003ED16788
MDQAKITVPPIGLTRKYPDIGTGPVATELALRHQAKVVKDVVADYERREAEKAKG